MPKYEDAPGISGDAGAMPVVIGFVVWAVLALFAVAVGTGGGRTR